MAPKRSMLVWLAVTAAAALPMTVEAQGRKTHVVELEADREKEIYRFSPAQLNARAGDVVVFRAKSGAPHSVVFEGEELSPEAQTALSQALGRRQGELSSPMLTKNGAEYKMVLPKLPAGTYSYFCLPHRAYDERGTLVVHK